MANDNATNLFIHSSLFMGDTEIVILRDYLENSNPINNSTIMGISGKELLILEQTPAHKNLSLTDTAFEHLIKQKISDGYIYASVHSFKKFIGLY